MRFTGAAAFLAAVLAAVPAFAMDTNDPGTIAPGTVEIEVSAARSTSPGGSESALALSATTGVLGNFDVSASVPFLTLDPDERRGERGPGDLEAGLKLRFLEGAGARPALALTVGVTLPTGDEERGLGTGEADYTTTLLAGFALAPVSVYLDLGYGQITSADRESGEKAGAFAASAAVEWAAAEPLALNAEILYESARARDEDILLAVAGGASYALSDALAVDAGARICLTDAAPDWGVSAAVTLTIGR